jgi:hypothetical protein
MTDNNDEISFDEVRARELVYFLLDNDTNIFKKFIPDIKALNSESFENLFQGIPYKKMLMMKKDIIIMLKIKKCLKNYSINLIIFMLLMMHGIKIKNITNT